MLWKKERYIVPIKGGVGEVTTMAEHGLIQQMVVEPTSRDTVWSMEILDRDNDSIYKIIDFEGQLNDRAGIPIGKDQPEKLKIRFFELTKNEDMKVLLNIKEIK